MFRSLMRISLPVIVALQFVAASPAEEPAKETPGFFSKPWDQYRHDVGYVRRGAQVSLESPLNAGVWDRLRRYEAIDLLVQGADVDAEVLGRIAEFENIEGLTVAESTAGDGGIEKLKRLERLRELSLYDLRTTPRALTHLASHRRLELLRLFRCEIDADGLAAIGQLPELRQLEFFEVAGLQDDHLKALGQLKKLETLSVDRSTFTGKGLAHLSELAHLRTLYAPLVSLNDEDVEHLQKLSRLERLWISENSRLTRRAVAKLKQMPCLREINGIPVEWLSEQLPGGLEKKTVEALAEDTQLEFIDTPLSDVVEYLAVLHGVPFRIDDDLARRRFEPITLKVERISLRSGLDLMLEPPGLSWMFDRESIVITTRDSVSDGLMTRTYDLAHLVGEHHGAAAEFARIIPQIVSPNDWRIPEDGMSPTISARGTRLTVSHSRLAHRRIEEFLEEFGPRGNGHRMHAGDRIRRALEQPIEIDGAGPLNDYVDHLRDFLGIPIYLDRASLKTSGVTTNMRVTIKAKGLPASEVLRQITEPAKLAWSIRHGVVFVTSEARDERLLETRVYHVGELLSEKTKAADVAARLGRHETLADKPNRKAVACINRVVVRATFLEHRAIEKVLGELPN